MKVGKCIFNNNTDRLCFFGVFFLELFKVNQSDSLHFFARSKLFQVSPPNVTKEVSILWLRLQQASLGKHSLVIWMEIQMSYETNMVIVMLVGKRLAVIKKKRGGAESKCVSWAFFQPRTMNWPLHRNHTWKRRRLLGLPMAYLGFSSDTWGGY